MLAVSHHNLCLLFGETITKCSSDVSIVHSKMSVYSLHCKSTVHRSHTLHQRRRSRDCLANKSRFRRKTETLQSSTAVRRPKFSPEYNTAALPQHPVSQTTRRCCNISKGNPMCRCSPVSQLQPLPDLLLGVSRNLVRATPNPF